MRYEIAKAVHLDGLRESELMWAAKVCVDSNAATAARFAAIDSCEKDSDMAVTGLLKAHMEACAASHQMFRGAIHVAVLKGTVSMAV